MGSKKGENGSEELEPVKDESIEMGSKRGKGARVGSVGSSGVLKIFKSFLSTRPANGRAGLGDEMSNFGLWKLNSAS